jgi:hypothetical protein
MKKLLLVSVILSVSCTPYFTEHGRLDYFLKLDKELAEILSKDAPCEVKIADLEELSKTFERHIDESQERNFMKWGMLYCDFESLFLQAKYEEAYQMGIEVLPQLDEFWYQYPMKAVLATIAKLLDRFPEYEQEADLWQTYTADELKGVISDIVQKHCNDDLQRMGIPEWAASLESPVISEAD